MRHGRFTSSQIHKLMTSDKSGKEFGKPALTYIEEKRLERKLKRSLTTDAYSKSMAWGEIIESYVFSLLPLEYDYVSKETIVHPQYEFWAGTPDLIIKGKLISEIKCYEPKNFALYTEALLSRDVERIKKEFPDEYWQMISNACIIGAKEVEAISFMPYESEAEAIKKHVEEYQEYDSWKYRYIYELINAQLLYKMPFLPNDSEFKNLNIVRFEAPKEDKELLTERVIKANKLIENV